MKKAKRLLAMLLAFVMLFSAASVSTYAASDDYGTPTITAEKRFKFSADQGASYILDMIDNMLAEMGDELYITNDEMGISDTLVGVIEYATRTDIWHSTGLDLSELDLTSIDSILAEIGYIFGRVGSDANFLVKIAESFNVFGNIFDCINVDDFNGNLRRTSGPGADLSILKMLVNWITYQEKLFTALLTGTLDAGAFDSMISDLINDLLGDGAYSNMTGAIRTLLYGMLVDSNIDTIAEFDALGTTIDAGLQKVIDWALVEGTGSVDVDGDNAAAKGAFSILGENHEPLMPAVADEPGGASLTTISVYQMVSNLIQGLLNSMAVPMVSDLLYDLVGIEITETYPGGDPAILQDEMFVLIVGLVEDLCVSNGAPEINYTEEDNATPAAKIDKLVKWFFNDGGLDTFILIDYYGFHIQDNFMSLLNDIARLAINLLPSLGLEIDAEPSYTAAQLNEVKYYNEAGELCLATDEGAIDKTYMTYEDGTILIPAEVDDNGDPLSYNYLSSGLPLDTNAYKESLVRPNYVISTDMVYASIIKMVLTMFIDGTYFPAWAEDIPSVLAYGLAAIGVKVLPGNNYFERLDAYHEKGNDDPYTNAGGNVVYPIRYERTTNAGGARSAADSSVTIPVGALKIGAEIGAFYLNGILENANRPFNTTDSSLERFLAEFLLWALDTYMPVFVGHPVNTEGAENYGYFDGNGMWTGDINTLVALTYGDGGYITNTPLEGADWYAVYTFLDNTLFGLIPASWLPSNLAGSFDLLNRWLLESLCNFDLQGILGFFSVNETGELNETLIVVLLRVIDRLLATVMNGTPLLPSTDRTDVYAENTTVTTLHALLDCSSESAPLCVLITQLLHCLQAYQNDLLAVVLPFLVSTAYNKPFDFTSTSQGPDSTVWLDTTMSQYNIDKLEEYIAYFTEDINAVLVDTYPTEEEAEAAIEALKETNYNTNYYIKGVEIEGQTAVVDGEEVPVYEYEVWENKSFMVSATGTPITDDYGDLTSYSGFTYDAIIPRSSSLNYVTYDNAAFRFFEAEDWRNDLYAYNNINTAIEKADEFVGSYKESFPKNDLPAAYQEWLMFSYASKLYQKDMWDTNGDGKSVLSDTDTDYKAATTDDSGNVTDAGYPVDGEPSIPEAMYPYLTTDSTTVSFRIESENATVEQYRYSFTKENYEQIQWALDYAADPENMAVLSDEDAEIVVRLALNTITFDITPDSDGYPAGTVQWDGLTSTDIDSLRTWCAENDMELTNDEETGAYIIKVVPFKLITESTFSLLNETVSVTPPDARTDKYTTPNYSQQIANAVYYGYRDYAASIYSNKKTVYNHIDLISDRYEEAKSLLPTQYTAIDTTMLKWAMAHVYDSYVNPDTSKRNVKLVGVVNGVPQTSKVYTTKSYERFREAYDFAYSLNQASLGKVAATGLTQSMVSYAFAELMTAFNALVLYTGDADFTQLDAYIAIATQIKEDPNKDHPQLGYTTETYNALVAELEEALIVRNDPTIDCESQRTVVDKAAADLYDKINGLIYNSVPMLKPAVDEAGNNVVETVELSQGARVVGHIFGLEVGKGINVDAVDVVGMRIEEGVGNVVQLTESGRGTGTGAFIKGSIGNIEKFRYYAVVYGDLNGDAIIDGTDMSAIELYELNKESNIDELQISELQFEAADVNRDGEVDSHDAHHLVQYYNYNAAYPIDQGEHTPVVMTVSE